MLIETAKANNIDPYRYLVALFKKPPLAQTVDDYKALLPWNIGASQAAKRSSIPTPRARAWFIDGLRMVGDVHQHITQARPRRRAR